MSGPVTLRTERLVLRPWRESDRVPYAALNADPEVMRYFPSTLTQAESDASVDRIVDGFARRGFGLWAVEVAGGAPFVGFVGLDEPAWEAHFTPCVEVGWRLARAHWGKGYATEAARAAVAFGFDVLGLDEIVSFTVPANSASRAVMERLGMTTTSRATSTTRGFRRGTRSGVTCCTGSRSAAGAREPARHPTGHCGRPCRRRAGGRAGGWYARPRCRRATSRPPSSRPPSS
ncbi:MAG: hypothetical protein KatS3mg010_1041 [Acidimicrobiia bacterium]|nr:MAG: hypothetical protein KatS3mg010_1041 [Acidimicrobiia bacterium]